MKRIYEKNLLNGYFKKITLKNIFRIFYHCFIQIAPSVAISGKVCCVSDKSLDTG